MAVTLTGTSSGNQGLFNRLGVALNTIEVLNAVLGGASNDQLPAEFADLSDLFDGVQAESILSPLASLQQGYDAAQQMAIGWNSRLAAFCRDLIINQVDSDNPLPALTIESALAELRRQMLAASASVDANEPSATFTPGGSNAGTGTVVVSLKTEKGETLQFVYPEDIEGTVTGNTTAGAESWSFRGESARASKLHPLWPGGSGSTKTVTSRLPTATQSKVTNGGFETAGGDANNASGWTASVGTVPTHHLRDTGTAYRGTCAWKFIGDGSTLHAITQAVTANVAARTHYAVLIRHKASAAPSTGVLTIDLYDGSSTIQDEAGTNSSFTVDLTALTTSWSVSTGVFILPDPLPAAVTLRLRCTTAIQTGKNVFIDDICLLPMTRLYTGGPYVCPIGGATNWALDDTGTLAVSNDFRGEIQTWFGRLFPTMVSNDLFLPSATGGGETIADSLIG